MEDDDDMHTQLGTGQRETGDFGLILKELREFRKDRSQQLNAIREEINKSNTRIEEAEKRIDATETRVKEGAEENSPSMVMYVECLLREGLELPATFELRVESSPRLDAEATRGSPAEEGVVMYGSAEEATEDMAKRGFPVSVIKHRDSLLERIQRFTWQTVKRPGNRHRAGRALDYKEKLQALRHQESG
ncbi:unnamed protein product [Leuciscus chuanchicus]